MRDGRERSHVAFDRDEIADEKARAAELPDDAFDEHVRDAEPVGARPVVALPAGSAHDYAVEHGGDGHAKCRVCVCGAHHFAPEGRP